MKSVFVRLTYIAALHSDPTCLRQTADRQLAVVARDLESLMMSCLHHQRPRRRAVSTSLNV